MMRGQLPLARVVRQPLSRSRPAHVCFQCRAIQISAAPTTESPQTGGDAFGAPAQGFRDTAGMVVTYKPEEFDKNRLTALYRCAFRSPRLTLLAPLRNPLRLPEAIHTTRNTCHSRWQGAKCRCTDMRLLGNWLTGCLGTILPQPPLSVPPRPSGHAFPLPAHLLDVSNHSANCHQIAKYNLFHSPPRWYNRLASRSAKRPARMDRSHSCHHTEDTARTCSGALGEPSSHRSWACCSCCAWTNI